MTQTDGRDAKRIGDLGEAQFKSWAIEAHAVANKVEHDEHGWDFVVELSRGTIVNGNKSLDLMPCELHCFVQVKTITSPGSRVAIALSNWNRMVKDPAPWFVMVIVLDDNDRACDAFLVHIDETWCGRVLKRLREIPESEASTLHRRTLELAWDPAQRFSELHGRSFEAGIRFHAGTDPVAYSKRKSEWISTVGYGPERHVLNIQIAASAEGEANRMRAEFAVGIRPALPVAALRAEEIRFDIPKTMHATEEGATLELVGRQPHFSARVSFGKLDRSRTVELVCAGYAAEVVFHDLPEEFRLRRLVADHCEILIRSERSHDLPPDQLVLALEFKFTSPASGEVTNLRELGLTAAAALLLHGSLLEPIRMAYAPSGGHPFSRDDVVANAGIDPESFHYWTMIDHAARLAKRFDVGLEVDAAAIVQQAEALRFLGSSMDGPERNARFTTRFHTLEQVEFRPDRAAVVSMPYVVLARHVICFYLALIGQPTWTALDDGSQNLEVRGPTRVMRELCVPVEEWDQFDLVGTFGKVQLALNEEGISFVIGMVPNNREAN